MTIILLILTVFFGTLGIIFFNYIAINPSTVVSAGFLVGTLALLFSIQDWQVQLSFKTIQLISLGLGFFLVGSLLPYIAFKVNRKNEKLIGDQALYEKKIIRARVNSTSIAIIAVFFQIFVTVYLYIYLRSATQGTGLSEIISTFRNSTMSSGDDGLQITGFLKQLQVFSMAYSFVFAFLYFYKRIVEDYKCSFLYIIPLLFYIFQSLLTGGRLQIFRVILFIGSSIYFLQLYKKDSPSYANYFILKVGKWIIGIIPVFYFLKNFLGRTSEDSFFQYIFRYLGGPIEGLDLFIKSNYSYSHMYGQETFAGVYSLLAKSGIENQPIKLSWIMAPTGIWVGNVYTAFRRYYSDFGLSGVAILMFMLGIFFGVLFSNIVRGHMRKEIAGFSIILYSFYFYSLVFTFFDDTFYTTAISLGSLVQIIEMYVIYRLFTYRQMKV